jgi:hypothetical protein
VSEQPRIEVVQLGETRTDPIVQRSIASHRVDLPGVGPVVMHHADGVNVGSIELDEGAPRLMIQLVHRPCGCGCGHPGLGLLLTPSVEHAREIGEALILLAGEQEQAAAAQAAAALRRAGGAR